MSFMLQSGPRDQRGLGKEIIMEYERNMNTLNQGSEKMMCIFLKRNIVKLHFYVIKLHLRPC